MNDRKGFFDFGRNRKAAVRNYTVTAVTVITAVRILTAVTILTAEICSYGRYNGHITAIRKPKYGRKEPYGRNILTVKFRKRKIPP